MTSFVSSAFDSGQLKTASSSGSTGVPLTILRDKSEYLIENNFVARAWAPFELDKGDRTVVLRTGYDPRQGEGISFIDGRGTVWVQLTDLSDCNLSYVLEELQRFKPVMLRGNGSLVAAVLAYSLRVGRPFSSLKGVGYSSDEMFPAERKLIRETLGLNLISLWGQTERAGMAITRPKEDEFHVVTDYGFVELVRPDGSIITQPGEYGLIVGTSLFPRATAMLRYVTGDYAAWSRPGVFSSIVGRGTGSMICRRGHRMVFPVDVREAVVGAVPKHSRIQFVQLRPGELILRVDKPISPEMSEMIQEFEKLADLFDLDIHWNASLVLAPSGKRQLYTYE